MVRLSAEVPGTARGPDLPRWHSATGYSAVPTPPKKSSPGCFGCLGIILAVVAALAVIFGAIGANRATHPTDEDKQVESKVAFQEVVKKNLKTPSTASFSNVSASGTDGSYTVTGEVDSQNSFGAMIRNRFTCESDSETVHLTSLG